MKGQIIWLCHRAKFISRNYQIAWPNRHLPVDHLWSCACADRYRWGICSYVSINYSRTVSFLVFQLIDLLVLLPLLINLGHRGSSFLLLFLLLWRTVAGQLTPAVHPWEVRSQDLTSLLSRCLHEKFLERLARCWLHVVVHFRPRETVCQLRVLVFACNLDWNHPGCRSCKRQENTFPHHPEWVSSGGALAPVEIHNGTKASRPELQRSKVCTNSCSSSSSSSLAFSEASIRLYFLSARRKTHFFASQHKNSERNSRFAKDKVQIFGHILA